MSKHTVDEIIKGFEGVKKLVLEHEKASEIADGIAALAITADDNVRNAALEALADPTTPETEVAKLKGAIEELMKFYDEVEGAVPPVKPEVLN
jgi:hypothetical protein